MKFSVTLRLRQIALVCERRLLGYQECLSVANDKVRPMVSWPSTITTQAGGVWLKCPVSTTRMRVVLARMPEGGNDNVDVILASA